MAGGKTAASTEVSATSTAPISKRSVDYLLAFWFLVFAFSTTFTDLHNFTASLKGVEVHELEHMDLIYPPKILTYLYFKWARTVDPLLYQNPVWWQCIEWVNLLCLTPFAFVAIIGFLRGWNWIRIPAIVVSSFTFYSLILCIGTTL
jgi:EXPERA (EXPanded EBP superfamily)